MIGRQLCMSTNDYFAQTHLPRAKNQCSTQLHNSPVSVQCGMPKMKRFIALGRSLSSPGSQCTREDTCMGGIPPQKRILFRKATVRVACLAVKACLAVEAVVDVVDDVLRAGLQEDEVRVVLLDRGRLRPREARLRVPDVRRWKLAPRGMCTASSEHLLIYFTTHADRTP